MQGRANRVRVRNLIGISVLEAHSQLLTIFSYHYEIIPSYAKTVERIVHICLAYIFSHHQSPIGNLL